MRPDSAEQAFTEEIAENRQRSLRLDSIIETIGAELSIIAGDILDLQQGRQSGGVVDVFAQYREQFQRRNRVPNMTF